jgi:hypothetical protein
MPSGADVLAACMDLDGWDITAIGIGPGVVVDSRAEASLGREVKIANNQMVALHSQDCTKRAIREGTAILVQCIKCQNWMQVTDLASLMFCPICQVVSPVIKQSKVLSKVEPIQLTMDRRLAKKLQAKYNNQGIEDVEEEGKLH